MKLSLSISTLFLVIVLSLSCSAPATNKLTMQELYPWCIVAYDSVERSPTERISMMKDLGFTKYAYDWRNRHLDSASAELKLAIKNDIEVVSVWLWLNAKRDSVDRLSEYNERLIEIVESIGLETTIWVSMSSNFFNDREADESFDLAVRMIDFISRRAKEINCDVALYNHGGWFGDPYNQLKVIEALPNRRLSLVYNFHHGRESIDEFHELVKVINPYLSAVNLNGMKREGDKIQPIGSGNYEQMMMQSLLDEGFQGPWGILGHVEDADVQKVLERNLEGLRALGFLK